MTCSIIGTSVAIGILGGSPAAPADTVTSTDQGSAPAAAAQHATIVQSASEAARLAVRPAAPQLDAVALTGFLAAIALLICYAHQRQGKRFVLGCAVVGGVGAAYCLLQGAWPLAIVEAVWAVAAFRRWRAAQPDSVSARQRPHDGDNGYWAAAGEDGDGMLTKGGQPWVESRVSRLFGTR